MKWIKKGIETTVEQVFLRNIGVTDLEQINEWFRKSYDDKYFIKCIQKAVDLALSFKDQPVTIVGDYDGDGVTSTSILYLAMQWAGFKDVRYRIPKRFSEGFGINMTIIDEIESGLVITCDNGVAQVDAMNAAKEKGLTVIIIDHHLPQVEEGKIVLPKADFIIDPNAIEGQAAFNGYCGAGLSYKFAKCLLKGIPGAEAKIRVLLGFAAIGTVTDVMELREENYVFVRNGLKNLTNSALCTSGLYALVSALNLSKCISAHDVGFKVGPTLNAASRMDDDGAKNVVKLLTYCGSYPQAVTMAERLIAINDERKKAKKLGLQKAQKVIEDQCLFGDVPLIVYVPDTKEGIIGILAGQLAETYKVPAIVVTDTEEGILKGSARSYGNYDMKSELDKVADLLIRYGGHTGAAGLSLEKDNLEVLRQRMSDNVKDFTFESVDEIYYDLEIASKDIPAVLEELKKYEPYGEGNPQIVFKVKDFSTVPKYGNYKKLIGEDESIVKIFSTNSTAIGFDMAERMKNINSAMKLNLLGTLSTNYFGGQAESQIEFYDFESQKNETVSTPLADRLRSMAMAH